MSTYQYDQRILMYGFTLSYTGCSSLWSSLCSFATWKLLRSELSDAVNLSSLRSFIFYCPAFTALLTTGYPGRIGSRTHKKRHTLRYAFTSISDFLSSRAVSSQVLSAFMSLTTVFEMGTGGSS